MSWFKTIDHPNVEIWECDTCNRIDHNYVVIKDGIIEDKRKNKNKGMIEMKIEIKF